MIEEDNSTCLPGRHTPALICLAIELCAAAHVHTLRCPARTPPRAFALLPPVHCILTRPIGAHSCPQVSGQGSPEGIRLTVTTALHPHWVSISAPSCSHPFCSQVSGQDSPEGITSFEDVDLPPSLMENVKRCKYTKPTPVQVGSHTRH